MRFGIGKSRRVASAAILVDDRREDHQGRGHVETGDARIFCPGGSCTASYAPGATVQVNAVPDEGALLEDWAGDCSPFGAQPTFSVVMDRDITCTAAFASR